VQRGDAAAEAQPDPQSILFRRKDEIEDPLPEFPGHPGARIINRDDTVGSVNRVAMAIVFSRSTISLAHLS